MSARVRVLRAAGHVTMPWKNGGGVTTEIAIHPAGASLDTFLWRVSMAHVASDGPFSRFDGVDRTLVLLDGRGIRLEIDGRAPVTLVEGSDPLPFPADVPAAAHPLDGPIRDLNVMTRRGRYRHAIERLDVGNALEWTAAAPLSLLLSCDTGAEFEVEGHTHALDRDDVAVLGGSGTAPISLKAHGTARLFAIGLWAESRP